jgi:hypothetical protein
MFHSGCTGEIGQCYPPLKRIRVVHSSHFRAIFSSFLISFLISFFKNELENDIKNESKMDPSWCFCKNDHFHSHFHFPFFSFFQTPLWHLILCSDHHHQWWCPLPHTSTTITTPSPPTITTPTPTPARAMSGHRQSISDGTWAQTTATCHLGSRVLFFCSSLLFYMLTALFIFRICNDRCLHGTTYAPTHLRYPSPSKQDVRGLD